MKNAGLAPIPIYRRSRPEFLLCVGERQPRDLAEFSNCLASGNGIAPYPGENEANPPFCPVRRLLDAAFQTSALCDIDKPGLFRNLHRWAVDSLPAGGEGITTLRRTAAPQEPLSYDSVSVTARECRGILANALFWKRLGSYGPAQEKSWRLVLQETFVKLCGDAHVPEQNCGPSVVF